MFRNNIPFQLIDYHKIASHLAAPSITTALCTASSFSQKMVADIYRMLPKTFDDHISVSFSFHLLLFPAEVILACRIARNDRRVVPILNSRPAWKPLKLCVWTTSLSQENITYKTKWSGIRWGFQPSLHILPHQVRPWHHRQLWSRLQSTRRLNDPEMAPHFPINNPYIDQIQIRWKLSLLFLNHYYIIGGLPVPFA